MINRNARVGAHDQSQVQAKKQHHVVVNVKLICTLPRRLLNLEISFMFLRLARPRALSVAFRRTCTTATQTAAANKQAFKDSYNKALVHAGKPVALWLTGCASIVAGVVCVGGLTRLTRSGMHEAMAFEFALCIFVLQNLFDRALS